jgi:hypothetical protein
MSNPVTPRGAAGSSALALVTPAKSLLNAKNSVCVRVLNWLKSAAVDCSQIAKMRKNNVRLNFIFLILRCLFLSI